MKVVAIISQKGGAGKTTIATELAVAAHLAGYNTAIFDLDPQASAAVWGDDRKGAAPQVVAVQAPRLALYLETARDQGCEVVLLDTAPHADSIAVAAARVADLVLIPCKPSPRDAVAVGTSLSTLSGLAAKPCHIIINEERRTVMGGVMARALEDYAALGAKLCPVRLGDRTAFVAALTRGQSSTEWEPDGRAASEVGRLWRWLAGELGLPGTRKAGNSKTREVA